jgi:CRP/FNR family transcriptional regulator, cyclic AMP receptor protein
MTTPGEVLAGVPLFSMLPKKEVAKLARRANELTVPAGTVVTDVDRAGVSFGVILDGQAAVSVYGQPVRVLGPGDYFGEMALIDESSRYRSAKITAETELHCLMFPKWDFRPFAMSHPQTVWALLEMMAQRVRDAEKR